MKKVKRIKKSCETCGKVFEVPLYWNYVKNCSKKCGRKAQAKKMINNTHGFQKGHKIGKGRKLSKLTREKVSISMKEQYMTGIRDKKTITKKANEAVRKYGQPKLRNKPSWIKGKTKANGSYPNHIGFKKGKENVVIKYPKKHPNYILAQKGHKTQPETVMEDLLIKNNIYFKFQVNIGKYWVDFLIPENKIILECDGDYWHKKPNYERNDFLKSQGYIVLHWHIKKYSSLQIKESAIKFLEENKSYFIKPRPFPNV